MYSNTKRGQISLEFFVYVGFAGLLTLLIITLALDHARDLQKERKQEALDDFAAAVQYQMVTLASTRTGMTLHTTLPNKIDNKYEYTIAISSTSMTISLDDIDTILPIPRLIGNLTTGQNTIVNRGDALVVS